MLAYQHPAESFIEAPALEAATKGLAEKQGKSLVGQQLGSYKILSLLGAGGMGEVYRARDTRLDRMVAIKVLPAELSGSSELRERLKREARIISSLTHPHICTLYDVGHQDGMDYLVMEYLEGETLAHRLMKGAVPADQVLRYGIEIAEALDQAHRHGVTHRDLKPGNIMLTKTGAKLLDFGLAKLRAPVSVAMSSAVPTAPGTITAEGTLLGTLQYMAPEQLEGKEADARTDIFAYGAVLYEMATGRKAFEGKSQASLIAAILEHDPPAISSLQPLVPAALDHVVKACLAKDPDVRRQTAHDVMLELKWMAEAGLQAPGPVRLSARKTIRERLAWAVATVLFLALLTLAVVHFRPKPEGAMPSVPGPSTAVRLFLLPPEKTTFADLYLFGPDKVSPDGLRLAFVAAGSDGNTLLWVRPLDSLSAQPLPGTEGATFPFWSADSRFLGFFAGGKLKKIEASGGPAVTLCDAREGRGGTWNRDGVIVFGPNMADALYRVSAVGGAPVPVTTLDPTRGEDSHRWPQFLPDGTHFLYLAQTASEEYWIYVGTLGSMPESPGAERQPSKGRKLLTASSNVAYAPPGYLLYLLQGTLMAQPFDAQRVQLSGEAIPVAKQVRYEANFQIADFSVSDTGVLAYRSGNITTQLVWFDRGGKQLESVGTTPARYSAPRLSPDEQTVAVERLDPQRFAPDIWLFGLSRATSSRFTFDPVEDLYPVWSPDGSRIVFGSYRDGPLNLYQKALSDTGNPEALFKSKTDKSPNDWSRDGRFIAYENWDRTIDLWVLPLDGDRKPFPFLQTQFNERSARFSPDGRWMAYDSDESGTGEVYVQSFQGRELTSPSEARRGRWQVSTGGGNAPTWRADGKELFYISGDGKLMAVEVKGGATFQVGGPRELFRVHSLSPFYGYCVTADGQRFLVNMPLEDVTSSPIIVVLNWTAALRH